MTNEEAIKILNQIRRESEGVLKLKLDNVTKEIYTNQLEMCNLAIQALEKQISKKPIMKPWDAASCPYCGAHLSESLGDGYYKHWTSLKFCDCGQNLEW